MSQSDLEPTMNTATFKYDRLDLLLLYQFLLVAALLLLAAPFITQITELAMLLLFSLQIVLTSIATLVATFFKQSIDRVSVSILFALWLLVWITHLL
jgi:hypothetical protein